MINKKKLRRTLNYIPFTLGAAFLLASPLIYSDILLAAIGGMSAMIAGFCWTTYLKIKDALG